MKTHLLFLVCLFIGGFINAQTPIWWPTHPMDTHIGNKPELQPDSVATISLNPEWATADVHAYGDNGYIDTVMYRSIGNVCFSFTILGYVNTYSKENNKLISTDGYRSFYQSVLSYQIFYEYDSIGRLIKKQIVNHDKNNPRYQDRPYYRDTIISYDFSTINYTDSGYIFDGGIYSLDEKGRITKEIRDKDTILYIYYDDELRYDKIINMDNYFENTAYFFNENGLMTKSITYSKPFENEDKRVREYFYSFLPGNTTSNSIIVNSSKIYGITGGLIIETEKPEWISVYSLSGQLIKKTYINYGTQQIPLAKGIYIVKSGQKTTKIGVR